VTLWPAIEASIREAAGNAFAMGNCEPVAGGSINEAWRVEGGGDRYFVKLNRADRAEMFTAESEGLTELRQGSGLRVPAPICRGATAGRAYLVLEWIDLQPLENDAAAALGEALAQLHGIVRPEYGWHRDNTIGSTLQRNTRTTDWTEFWRENRLGYQLSLAAEGHDDSLAREGDRLLTKLDTLLEGHRPEPSLVHGDLWGGNVAMDSDGRPVIFDPAVYYGDRETDLAMCELFGGIQPVFFEAYHGAWPIDAGYREVRRDLYQLYHLLNHYNLFGGHYGAESLHRIRRLLSKT